MSIHYGPSEAFPLTLGERPDSPSVHRHYADYLEEVGDLEEAGFQRALADWLEAMRADPGFHPPEDAHVPWAAPLDRLPVGVSRGLLPEYVEWDEPEFLDPHDFHATKLLDQGKYLWPSYAGMEEGLRRAYIDHSQRMADEADGVVYEREATVETAGKPGEPTAYIDTDALTGMLNQLAGAEHNLTRWGRPDGDWNFRMILADALQDVGRDQEAGWLREQGGHVLTLPHAQMGHQIFPGRPDYTVHENALASIWQLLPEALRHHVDFLHIQPFGARGLFHPEPEIPFGHAGLWDVDWLTGQIGDHGSHHHSQLGSALAALVRGRVNAAQIADEDRDTYWHWIRQLQDARHEVIDDKRIPGGIRSLSENDEPVGYAGEEQHFTNPDPHRIPRVMGTGFFPQQDWDNPVQLETWSAGRHQGLADFQRPYLHMLRPQYHTPLGGNRDPQWIWSDAMIGRGAASQQEMLDFLDIPTPENAWSWQANDKDYYNPYKLASALSPSRVWAMANAARAPGDRETFSFVEPFLESRDLNHLAPLADMLQERGLEDGYRLAKALAEGDRWMARFIARRWGHESHRDISPSRLSRYEEGESQVQYSHPAFQSSILDDPAEDTNWLVYADWLEEQGHIKEAARMRWMVRARHSLDGLERSLLPRREWSRPTGFLRHDRMMQEGIEELGEPWVNEVIGPELGGKILSHAQPPVDGLYEVLRRFLIDRQMRGLFGSVHSGGMFGSFSAPSIEVMGAGKLRDNLRTPNPDDMSDLRWMDHVHAMSAMLQSSGTEVPTRASSVAADWLNPERESFTRWRRDIDRGVQTGSNGLEMVKAFVKEDPAPYQGEEPFCYEGEAVDSGEDGGEWSELPDRDYWRERVPYAGPHQPFHPQRNPGGFSNLPPERSVFSWNRVPGGNDRLTWPPEDLGRQTTWNAEDVFQLQPAQTGESEAIWVPTNRGVQRRVNQETTDALLMPQHLDWARRAFGDLGDAELHRDDFGMDRNAFRRLTPNELYRFGVLPHPFGDKLHDPDDALSREAFADFLDEEGWDSPLALDWRGHPLPQEEEWGEIPGYIHRMYPTPGARERATAQRIRDRRRSMTSLPLVDLPHPDDIDHNATRLSRYADDATWRAAINDDPREATIHGAMADWLDEEGRPEDANFRRAMSLWLPGAPFVSPEQWADQVRRGRGPAQRVSRPDYLAGMPWILPDSGFFIPGLDPNSMHFPGRVPVHGFDEEPNYGNVFTDPELPIFDWYRSHTGWPHWDSLEHSMRRIWEQDQIRRRDDEMRMEPPSPYLAAPDPDWAPPVDAWLPDPTLTHQQTDTHYPVPPTAYSDPATVDKLLHNLQRYPNMSDLPVQQPTMFWPIYDAIGEAYPDSPWLPLMARTLGINRPRRPNEHWNEVGEWHWGNGVPFRGFSPRQYPMGLWDTIRLGDQGPFNVFLRHDVPGWNVTAERPSPPGFTLHATSSLPLSRGVGFGFEFPTTADEPFGRELGELIGPGGPIPEHIAWPDELEHIVNQQRQHHERLFGDLRRRVRDQEDQIRDREQYHNQSDYAREGPYLNYSHEALADMLAQLASPEHSRTRWGHKEGDWNFRMILADALQEMGRDEEAHLLREEGRHVLFGTEGRVLPGRFQAGSVLQNHSRVIELIEEMLGWRINGFGGLSLTSDPSGQASITTEYDPDAVQDMTSRTKPKNLHLTEVPADLASQLRRVFSVDQRHWGPHLVDAEGFFDEAALQNLSVLINDLENSPTEEEDPTYQYSQQYFSDRAPTFYSHEALMDMLAQLTSPEHQETRWGRGDDNLRAVLADALQEMGRDEEAAWTRSGRHILTTPEGLIRPGRFTFEHAGNALADLQDLMMRFGWDVPGVGLASAMGGVNVQDETGLDDIIHHSELGPYLAGLMGDAAGLEDWTLVEPEAQEAHDELLESLISAQFEEEDPSGFEITEGQQLLQQSLRGQTQGVDLGDSLFRAGGPAEYAEVSPDVQERNQQTLREKRRQINRRSSNRRRSKLAAQPTEQLAAQISDLLAQHGPLRKHDLVQMMSVFGAPLDAALAHGGFPTSVASGRADGSGRQAMWVHPRGENSPPFGGGVADFDLEDALFRAGGQQYGRTDYVGEQELVNILRDLPRSHADPGYVSAMIDALEEYNPGDPVGRLLRRRHGLGEFTHPERNWRGLSLPWWNDWAWQPERPRRDLMADVGNSGPFELRLGWYPPGGWDHNTEEYEFPASWALSAESYLPGARQLGFNFEFPLSNHQHDPILEETLPWASSVLRDPEYFAELMRRRENRNMMGHTRISPDTIEDYPDQYARTDYSDEETIRRLMRQARDDQGNETLHGAIADAMDEFTGREDPIAHLIRRQYGLGGIKKAPDRLIMPMGFRNWGKQRNTGLVSPFFGNTAGVGTHSPFDLRLQHNEEAPILRAPGEWILHALQGTPDEGLYGYEFNFPYGQLGDGPDERRLSQLLPWMDPAFADPELFDSLWRQNNRIRQPFELSPESMERFADPDELDYAEEGWPLDYARPLPVGAMHPRFRNTRLGGLLWGHANAQQPDEASDIARDLLLQPADQRLVDETGIHALSDWLQEHPGHWLGDRLNRGGATLPKAFGMDQQVWDVASDVFGQSQTSLGADWERWQQLSDVASGYRSRDRYITADDYLRFLEDRLGRAFGSAAGKDVQDSLSRMQTRAFRESDLEAARRDSSLMGVHPDYAEANEASSLEGLYRSLNSSLPSREEIMEVPRPNPEWYEEGAMPTDYRTDPGRWRPLPTVSRPRTDAPPPSAPWYFEDEGKPVDYRFREPDEIMPFILDDAAQFHQLRDEARARGSHLSHAEWEKMLRPAHQAFADFLEDESDPRALLVQRSLEQGGDPRTLFRPVGFAQQHIPKLGLLEFQPSSSRGASSTRSIGAEIGWWPHDIKKDWKRAPHGYGFIGRVNPDEFRSFFADLRDYDPQTAEAVASRLFDPENAWHKPFFDVGGDVWKALQQTRDDFGLGDRDLLYARDDRFLAYEFQNPTDYELEPLEDEGAIQYTDPIYGFDDDTYKIEPEDRRRAPASTPDRGIPLAPAHGETYPVHPPAGRAAPGRTIPPPGHAFSNLRWDQGTRSFKEAGRSGMGRDRHFLGSDAGFEGLLMGVLGQNRQIGDLVHSGQLNGNDVKSVLESAYLGKSYFPKGANPRQQKIFDYLAKVGRQFAEHQRAVSWGATGKHAPPVGSGAPSRAGTPAVGPGWTQSRTTGTWHAPDAAGRPARPGSLVRRPAGPPPLPPGTALGDAQPMKGRAYPAAPANSRQGRIDRGRNPEGSWLSRVSKGLGRMMGFEHDGQPTMYGPEERDYYRQPQSVNAQGYRKPAYGRGPHGGYWVYFLIPSEGTLEDGRPLWVMSDGQPIPARNMAEVWEIAKADLPSHERNRPGGPSFSGGVQELGQALMQPFSDHEMFDSGFWQDEHVTPLYAHLRQNPGDVTARLALVDRLQELGFDSQDYWDGIGFLHADLAESAQRSPNSPRWQTDEPELPPPPPDPNEFGLDDRPNDLPREPDVPYARLDYFFHPLIDAIGQSEVDLEEDLDAYSHEQPTEYGDFEDRNAFHDQIRNDPLETTSHGAFADWLDDHDQPHAAERRRAIMTGLQRRLSHPFTHPPVEFPEGDHLHRLVSPSIHGPDDFVMPTQSYWFGMGQGYGTGWRTPGRLMGAAIPRGMNPGDWLWAHQPNSSRFLPNEKALRAYMGLDEEYDLDRLNLDTIHRHRSPRFPHDHDAPHPDLMTPAEKAFWGLSDIRELDPTHWDEVERLFRDEWGHGLRKFSRYEDENQPTQYAPRDRTARRLAEQKAHAARIANIPPYQKESDYLDRLFTILSSPQENHTRWGLPTGDWDFRHHMADVLESLETFDSAERLRTPGLHVAPNPTAGIVRKGTFTHSPAFRELASLGRFVRNPYNEDIHLDDMITSDPWRETGWVPDEEPPLEPWETFLVHHDSDPYHPGRPFTRVGYPDLGAFLHKHFTPHVEEWFDSHPDAQSPVVVDTVTEQHERLRNQPFEQMTYARTDYGEQEDFLAAIHANPLEATGHGAFADWLDEAGMADEAAFRRALAAWVQNRPPRFVEPQGYWAIPGHFGQDFYPPGVRGVTHSHGLNEPLWDRFGNPVTGQVGGPEHGMFGYPFGTSVDEDNPGYGVFWPSWASMEDALRESFLDGLARQRQQEAASQPRSMTSREWGRDDDPNAPINRPPEQYAKTHTQPGWLHPHIRGTSLGTALNVLGAEGTADASPLAQAFLDANSGDLLTSIPAHQFPVDMEMDPLFRLADWMMENEDHPFSTRRFNWPTVPHALNRDIALRRALAAHGFDPNNRDDLDGIEDAAWHLRMRGIDDAAYHHGRGLVDAIGEWFHRTGGMPSDIGSSSWRLDSAAHHNRLLDHPNIDTDAAGFRRHSPEPFTDPAQSSLGDWWQEVIDEDPKHPDRYAFGDDAFIPYDEGMQTTYAEDEDILRDVHQNPTDLTGHLALADWYGEHDQPQKESFRRRLARWVQTRLEAEGRGPRLSPAEAGAGDVPLWEGAPVTVPRGTFVSSTPHRALRWRHGSPWTPLVWADARPLLGAEGGATHAHVINPSHPYLGQVHDPEGRLNFIPLFQQEDEHDLDREMHWTAWPRPSVPINGQPSGRMRPKALAEWLGVTGKGRFQDLIAPHHRDLFFSGPGRMPLSGSFGNKGTMSPADHMILGVTDLSEGIDPENWAEVERLMNWEAAHGRRLPGIYYPSGERWDEPADFGG